MTYPVQIQRVARRSPIASLRRSRRSRRARTPWIAFAFLLLLALAAVFAPLWGGEPNATQLVDRYVGPSSGHLFGTDELGRDVLTRTIYGARVSVLVVVVTIGVAAVVGSGLGLLAGFYGGIPNAVVSRLIDATLGIPTLFFGLLFAVTIGPGLTAVVVAISLVLWARFARVVRAETLRVKNLDHVRIAEVIGCSRLRIVLVHVLPGLLAPIFVLMTVSLGDVVLIESTLSFLGAGIAPPTATWGGMIAEGQSSLSYAWWISLFPGLCIFLAVCSFNSVGDWISRRLDPREKGTRS